MRHVRLFLALWAAMLVLTSTAAGASPVRATMSTSSTKPLVGEAWRYTVVVKNRAGTPLEAKMRLQALRGRTVVGCWKRRAFKPCSNARAATWISFEGKRTGIIAWPERYAGMRLTFQALVVAGGRSLRLRAPVAVRRP
jgi:hypothetical protein